VEVEEGPDDGNIARHQSGDLPGHQVAREAPYDAISETRLILTDDLIRDALSKDNRARKEAKRNRGEPDDDVPEGAEADATDEHEQEL